MTTPFARLVLVSASALGLACAPAEEPLDPIAGTGGTGGTAGGSAGSGGSAASAGAGGTGGSSGGAGGTGGSSGAAASGGSGGIAAGGAGGAGAPSGGAGAASGAGGAGASSGGAAGMDAGGAGAGGAAGGAGGQSGSAGAAGSAAGSSGSAGGGAGGTGGGGAVAPSAGCGKSGRPSGGVVTVANDHIYTFPTTYDGNTPYPLFIGMHAAGNPIEQFRNLTNGSAFETNMVRAFPKSAGNEWNYNNDLAKVTGMYDDLMANYCIDKNRVFSSGHSSGAQMIVQILTHADAAAHMNYKAVAPVAASNYGAIVSPIPVMYIQGTNDTVRGGSGSEVVARFTAVNGCENTSMPYAGAATCTSSGTMVNPGCVSYQGCSEPTIWCSHNDPQYSNTSHGVPCFAVKAMYDFFTGLP